MSNDYARIFQLIDGFIDKLKAKWVLFYFYGDYLVRVGVSPKEEKEEALKNLLTMASEDDNADTHFGLVSHVARIILQDKTLFYKLLKEGIVNVESMTLVFIRRNGEINED